LRPNISRGKTWTAATPARACLESPLSGHANGLDIDLFGHRLEVSELGTAAVISRDRDVGGLPRTAAGRYRDTVSSSYDFSGNWRSGGCRGFSVETAQTKRKKE